LGAGKRAPEVIGGGGEVSLATHMQKGTWGAIGPTRTHRLENVGSGVLFGESETFLVDICATKGDGTSRRWVNTQTAL
jgi:hypothetical protein